MKKKVITILLSLVLVSVSIGNTQILAAETTEQEAEDVQETEPTEQEDDSAQVEEPVKEAGTENAVEEMSEEIIDQENEEPAEENESISELDSVKDESTVEEEDWDEAGTSEDEAIDVLEEEIEISDEVEDAQSNIVASGNCGANAKWTLSSTLVLTISGNGSMNNYSASNTPWYSYNSKIRSVVIDEGITSIGNHAFSSADKMTSVSLPVSITKIGDSSFSKCTALKSISIPNKVKSIGAKAFIDCTSLTYIYIPNSVTSIGNNVFQNCSSLEEITILDNVTVIENHAFYGCKSLKRIHIPDNVTSIGNSAFEGCKSLTSLTVPDSVTSIGERAFMYCESLKTVNIPDGVKKINWSTFAACSSLTNIIIPDSVTSIGGGAFDGSGLKAIDIPDSVTSIGMGAFSNCPIKSISFPKNLAFIKGFVCCDCVSLTNVDIPDGVTSIESYAFTGCSSLANIKIPDSVIDIEDHAFRISQKTPITIITNNPYVIDYCKSQGYEFFDNTAPMITKLSGHNGSDIWVSIGKREEATGYHIKYSETSNMANAKEIMLDGKDTTSKAISGLMNGKIYYVQAQIYKKAWNTTYWSKWSAVKSIRIEQTPYPTNVSKLSTFIGSHIKVDWTKTAGASGYHIKYADNSSMTDAKEVMVKGNSTFTKTLTGLKNGKTYYVKIQTYRTVSGKTYWSSWSSVKSIKVDQKPYGSSISKLTNPSSKAMNITWDKAPSATGYHIQYSTNSSMTGAKDITINNKDTLSKTVTGLTKGKTYYVRIQTFRKVSGKTYWSSWSKAKQIKITK